MGFHWILYPRRTKGVRLLQNKLGFENTVIPGVCSSPANLGLAFRRIPPIVIDAAMLILSLSGFRVVLAPEKAWQVGDSCRMSTVKLVSRSALSSFADRCKAALGICVCKPRMH